MKVQGFIALFLCILLQDATALSGAKSALPGQFPYQTLVQVLDFGTGRVDPSSLCNGALISDFYVLTAASCVRVGEEVTFQVTLGAFDISLENEESRVEHLVFDKIVHEGYNAETGENDIALLELRVSTEVDYYVEPIRLPSKKQVKNNFQLWNTAVSGWGYVKSDDKEQGNWVLRWFDSRVAPSLWCSLRNGGSSVKDTNFCLASIWKKGTCDGDAGSPVAITEKDGKPTLIGIASRSAAACSNHQPPVFTKITPYLDWISQKADIQLRE